MRQTSGTVRLWSRHGEHRLLLEQGVPVGLACPAEIDFLADTPARDLLRASTLFALSHDTLYELEAGAPNVARRIHINPLALITRGLRGLASRIDPAQIEALFEDRLLGVHPRAQVAELELLKFEHAVVAALRQRQRTYDELRRERVASKRALDATLFILHALSFFDDHVPVRWDKPEDAPHITAAPLPDKAPKQMVGGDVPTERDLEGRLCEMESETPFEILEAPVAASLSELHTAQVKQIFRYHPDRLGRHASVALRQLAGRLCGKITQAFAQLEDPAELRRQRELALEGTSERVQAADANQAVELAARAEKHMRGHDFGEAAACLARALAFDDGDPSYPVLLAWCRAQSIPYDADSPVEGIDTRYDDALQAMRVGLRTDPHFMRGRYLYAQLLKRSGRVDAAARQFRTVVRMQPQNIGAARELRLYQMRKRNDASLFQRAIRKARGSG